MLRGPSLNVTRPQLSVHAAGPRPPMPCSLGTHEVLSDVGPRDA